MTRIFFLALSEWLRAKTWCVLLGLMCLMLWMARSMVPYEVDATLAAPARGQVVYAVALLLAAVYAPAMGAEIGRAQVRRGHRLYWRALGVRDGGYYAAIVVAAILPLAFLLGVAGLAIRMMGSPDLSSWSIVQAMTLTGLAGCVALPLAIGLSQFTASSVSAFFAVGFNFAGFYGPAILDYARRTERISDSARRVIEMLYSLVPHLRIGDQSERIAFAWPEIPLPEFSWAMLYLLAWFSVIGVVGFFLFRKRSH